MTTSTAAPAVAIGPAAGSYPSGHEGFSREWDGAAWTGPAVTDPSATHFHAHHSFAATLRRAPFWLALGGIVSGLVLTWITGASFESNTVLRGLGGLLAVGGPLLALVLGTRRRLGLTATPLARATWWGIGSGAVALGFAYGVEHLVSLAFGLKKGEQNEGLLLLAGPIEEFGKLLVPVILLAVGVRYITDVRLGVWTVVVSGATFGVVEGIEYAAGLQQSEEQRKAALDTVSDLSESIKAPLIDTFNTGARIWVELGHVLWTVPAAVIIWLAVHHGRRSLAVAALIGWLSAAALHSFNDGVITLLPGSWPELASIIFITISYLLWYRPIVRRLVPPTSLADVPHRWLPPLPRH